jgi:hypothetical protein
VIKKLLILILLLNTIFMIIEINGFIPELAYYQTYYKPMPFNTNPLFVEDAFIPLFQIRPSGIYHSTIYFSFELVIIFAILLHRIKNHYLILIITFISIFSGSTALLIALLLFSLLLFIMQANTLKTTIFILTYWILWLIVYNYLYPSFFLYNYNMSDFTDSFFTRFDTRSSNSSYTANYLFFQFSIILFLIFSILYLIKKQFKLKIRYLYILIVLCILLTLHNLIYTLKLYLNLGMLTAYIHMAYNLNLNKDRTR